MVPAPVIIRREGQHAGEEPQRIVGGGGFEIRAVAAIMKNDENAHEKSGGQNRQRHHQPPGNWQADINQIPQAGIGNHRVGDLPQRPPQRWLLVLEHGRFPSRVFRR